MKQDALLRESFIDRPRHSNTFTVSVNVAAGSAVNFTLVYQELLQRKHGMYEYEINVKPGQAVEDFLIEVYIQVLQLRRNFIYLYRVCILLMTACSKKKLKKFMDLHSTDD